MIPAASATISSATPASAAIMDARPGAAARARTQAGRPFPALELASLAAEKTIPRDSDAIAGLPLSNVADELAQRVLTVLGREPWFSLRYGIVRLNGRDLSSAAESLCDHIRGEDALLQQMNAQLAIHIGKTEGRGQLACPARPDKHRGRAMR